LWAKEGRGEDAATLNPARHGRRARERAEKKDVHQSQCLRKGKWRARLKEKNGSSDKTPRAPNCARRGKRKGKKRKFFARVRNSRRGKKKSSCWNRGRAAGAREGKERWGEKEGIPALICSAREKQEGILGYCPQGKGMHLHSSCIVRGRKKRKGKRSPACVFSWGLRKDRKKENWHAMGRPKDPVRLIIPVFEPSELSREKKKGRSSRANHSIRDRKGRNVPPGPEKGVAFLSAGYAYGLRKVRKRKKEHRFNRHGSMDLNRDGRGKKKEEVGKRRSQRRVFHSLDCW